MFLKFTDTALEDEFRTALLQSRLLHIRLNCFAGILLILGFIYFDHQFIPADALEQSISIRLFFMTPLALGVLLMSFYEPARKKWQVYPVFPLAGIGMGVALIIKGTNSSLPIYYMTTGIIQYQIFSFFLLGLQLPAAIIISMTASLAFLSVAWLQAPETFLFVAATLMATTVVLLMAKWHVEYQERQLFLANKTILANEKLRAEADRAKINWLENLARFLQHEIKNAFLGARTSLVLLQKRFRIGDDDKYLNRARISIDSIQWHLDKVRDVTSLERSLANDEKNLLELDAFISRQIEDYRSIYPQSGFDASLNAGSVVININGERLRQLLDKLVANAIEHGTTGTSIEISTGISDDEYITISVKNAGPPLPENHEKLFDLFYSGKSTDEHSGNMGLGLHVVKSIAEHYGGYILAENLPQEQSVVFTVALPLPGEPLAEA